MSAYLRLLLLAIAIVLLAVSCSGCATTRMAVVASTVVEGVEVSGILEVR